jgi:hypothetical protein
VSYQNSQDLLDDLESMRTKKDQKQGGLKPFKDVRHGHQGSLCRVICPLDGGDRHLVLFICVGGFFLSILAVGQVIMCCLFLRKRGVKGKIWETKMSFRSTPNRWRWS